jgi:hypothetical protein
MMEDTFDSYIDGPRWMNFEIVLEYLAKKHNLTIETWVIKRLLRKRVYFEVEGKTVDINAWLNDVMKEFIEGVTK